MTCPIYNIKTWALGQAQCTDNGRCVLLDEELRVKEGLW